MLQLVGGSEKREGVAPASFFAVTKFCGICKNASVWVHAHHGSTERARSGPRGKEKERTGKQAISAAFFEEERPKPTKRPPRLTAEPHKKPFYRCVMISLLHTMADRSEGTRVGTSLSSCILLWCFRNRHHLGTSLPKEGCLRSGPVRSFLSLSLSLPLSHFSWRWSGALEFSCPFLPIINSEWPPLSSLSPATPPAFLTDAPASPFPSL